MSETLRDKASDLRRAFDASFAQPLEQALPSGEDFLAVRVCGQPYAMRLGDIAGIVGKRPITAVPASATGFLGLVGVRGQIVPVFSMAVLLGHVEQPEPPQWLVLCGAQNPVALAFAELEGYLRFASLTGSADSRGPGTTAQVVATDTQTRPVVDVPRIMASLRNQGGDDRLKKEE